MADTQRRPSIASVVVLLIVGAVALLLPLTWGSDLVLRYGRLTLLPIVAAWYGSLLVVRQRRR